MASETSNQHNVEALGEELENLKKENEALRFMFEAMSNKYIILQAHLQELNYTRGSTGLVRHLDSYNNDSNKRPRTEVSMPKPTQIFVKTDPKDKSLIVKDGFRWRKYGQKLTKDNSSPRACFRCPWLLLDVLLKRRFRDPWRISLFLLQRTKENTIMVFNIAYWENLSLSVTDDNPFRPPKAERIAIDLNLSEAEVENRGNGDEKRMLDHVPSLAKDPNFTIALAAAVARSITEQSKPPLL